MSSSDLQKEQARSYLSGGSMSYVDSLYEDYLEDPNSVPADWRDAFKALPQVNGQQVDLSHRDIREHFLQQASHRAAIVQTVGTVSKQAEVTDLINSYRTYGHLLAKLDPLAMLVRNPIPALEPSYYKLTAADMEQAFYAGENFSKDPIPLSKILQLLKATYCGSIGIEYMHIANTKETDWLQAKMEAAQGMPTFSSAAKKQLLEELIATDGLERYLGTKYVGQKRFSLEGGDALVPMVKEILRTGCTLGMKETVIGMAHRGRLNVLVNVLGKEPGQLFQEFEGKTDSNGRTGDVKYHLGFSSDIRMNPKQIVHVALAFNPSHLEIIGPVIEGSVRSRLRRRDDLDSKTSVIPVVIHGDAAFAGQGVVMETFNFSQARGYCTGGTVHIVVNNQIGFTTSNPLDARSTLYCTDVAKMVQAPVFHVNGDDPEAVLFATKLAVEFRMKFKRDVVLDLVCYRRHGHNEADEPAVTQPVMYQKIKTMRPLREIYADKLIQEAVLSKEEVNAMIDSYRNILDKGEAVVETVKENFEGKLAVDWTPYLNAKWTDKVNTAVSEKVLLELSKKLQIVPQGFSVHPVVQRLLNDREKMAEQAIPMNWGYAETMAFATLVHEGYGVRLSGQDCGRGTFAHRHAVLHDAVNGETFVPLEGLASNPLKPFAVIDSVLSEEAVLAFEYGYAASEPSSLVIWEAQFGDFANGAQVVIDQFISSGEQKWGRLCGLVMMLPHGYEGQGPEHSSARLERYRQLCAQQNMQICVPTTPAQIFHLLRRQVLRNFRKPLIIMTPKSLLRHKLAVSTMSELSSGGFQNIIGEIDPIKPEQVTKLVLCCGKVYYDLLEKRRESQKSNIAIIRIEQLYPFPKSGLLAELAKYPKANKVVWCQEEPKNQGVWFASQHNIHNCLKAGQELTYAGRPSAASPAVGSSYLHAQQQEELVEQALAD